MNNCLFCKSELIDTEPQSSIGIKTLGFGTCKVHNGNKDQYLNSKIVFQMAYLYDLPDKRSDKEPFWMRFIYQDYIYHIQYVTAGTVKKYTRLSRMPEIIHENDSIWGIMNNASGQYVYNTDWDWSNINDAVQAIKTYIAFS